MYLYDKLVVVMEQMVGMRDARRMLGVSARTLRRYTAEGKLPDRRSPGGQRIFSIADLEAVMHQRKPSSPETGVAGVVIYGRVSSRRQAQEGDLDRQMALLRECARGRVVVGEFSDVASGLSDRRAGLRRAIRACLDPEVKELWVTHKERLARFGVGIIEQLLASHDVRIVAIGEDEAISTSTESELVRDMLAVVTSFSERLYGARSAKAKALRRCVASGVKA